VALPIRPGFPQTAAPIQRPDTTPNAGQRAFFQAALGGQQQAAATQAAANPITRPHPMGRVPTDLPAEPPERFLRPGSLLDIKV
jgi:hypothetical protein